MFIVKSAEQTQILIKLIILNRFDKPKNNEKSTIAKQKQNQKRREAKTKK